MEAIVGSLISVVLVSLISLVGLVTLSMNTARIRKLATFFVSFAVGALLGDAFIHILPAAFNDRSSTTSTLTTSLMVLLGMLIFFIAEKLLRHTHGVLHAEHHGDLHTEHHDHAHGHRHRPELAAINIFGDVVHNLIDGILIGASYLVSPSMGISTTIAVALHEIPQELGDFGVLVHAGLTPRRAVGYNLAAASAAIVGTVIVLIFGSVAKDITTSVLLPITAGGFVYIAAADLIPELQHERRLSLTIIQTLLICAGIAIMGLLTLTEA